MIIGIEVRLSLVRERERGGAAHKSGRKHHANMCPNKVKGKTECEREGNGDHIPHCPPWLQLTPALLQYFVFGCHFW